MNLCPWNLTSLDSISTISHFLDSKITLWPLSQSWLIISKLWFKPSTRSTLLIELDEFSSILPYPMIFPLSLPLNVTLPPFLFDRKINFSLSPVICLEQPLSRTHLPLLAARHTYKKESHIKFWYPKGFGCQGKC